MSSKSEEGPRALGPEHRVLLGPQGLGIQEIALWPQMGILWPLTCKYRRMKSLLSSKEGLSARICLVLQAHTLYYPQSTQMPKDRQSQSRSESPSLRGPSFRPRVPSALDPSLIVSRASAGGRHPPKACSVPYCPPP